MGEMEKGKEEGQGGKGWGEIKDRREKEDEKGGEMEEAI